MFHCTSNHVNWSEWNSYYPQDFPRQENFYDSGITVCLLVYSLMTGNEQLNNQFFPAQTLQFRKWFSHVIIENSKEIHTVRCAFIIIKTIYLFIFLNFLV